MRTGENKDVSIANFLLEDESVDVFLPSDKGFSEQWKIPDDSAHGDGWSFTTFGATLAVPRQFILLFSLETTPTTDDPQIQ